ncbi:MAG: hypothetical protein KIT34_02260 [Cyanobacteria bacterium TGS_CYA1]|nr:hypothetical protein [Cyanobacteria bacterium TGS_CYA1]
MKKNSPSSDSASRKSDFSESGNKVNSKKTDLLSDLDSTPVAPSKKSKSTSDSRSSGDAKQGSKQAVDSVSRVSQKSRDSSRYKDSAAKEVHPAGSYCSATKHEVGSSKCLPEQLKAFMAQAQARANEGPSKTNKAMQEVQPSTASTIHIAQNLDLKNLDKSQGAEIKYQTSKFESFTAPAKHSEKAEGTPTKSGSKNVGEAASVSQKTSESATPRESKTSRSFSAPEYQIHQESLDFYKAHKKAFQTADERFQKMPADLPTVHEKNEHVIEQASPLRKPKIERIDPYYALNYQLAKENSLFNPPQGDYRVKSIEKADPVKHPDALALDIPESRILSHLPSTGNERILHDALQHASGIPIRAGEIIDAVEAMMEEDPRESTDKIKQLISDDDGERRMVMLLDGKHKGFLFPVKRSGEQAKQDATIPGITKIFLPDGNFKFVKGQKSAGKVHFPDLKDFIAKVKARLEGKQSRITEHAQAQQEEQEKTVRTTKPIFPQTVVSPQHTGTMVIKELKPGTPEPEPLAAQITKAQKTKQQEEAKKQEGKETRPESKTGAKDAYQGRLPEIKMSYTKSQPTTKDFTKLKPNEKLPIKETGTVPESREGEHATRIRDIYAKFDIQLPRKKLRPEITESGTYKIISNQTSQKLPTVSEDKMSAPSEVASFFREEDQFPGGDPNNPENQPIPKIAASMAEEPRKSYVVKQGETIEYIAVAELQEAALAPLIREVNAILLDQFFDHEKQEPASIIPAGVMILLPNKKDIIAYRLKVARNRH